MITEQELRDLINNGNELEWLDFKSEPYDISNSDRSVAEAQKTSFLKDVIAMANTPREKTAYIILGVKWYKDGTRDIQGIKKHFDDADLQPLLDSLKLNVRPQFVYQPMRLDDKVFGVVEIPIEKNMRGPYTFKNSIADQR
ncbi:MAG: putative DNA binding domain-containing protein [Anaerolineae bacterium]|nr:putative DNA binding domain-containing protein [Anaerolineae bacterium]